MNLRDRIGQEIHGLGDMHLMIEITDKITDMLERDYAFFELCNHDSGFGPLCRRDKGHLALDHAATMTDGKTVTWDDQTDSVVVRANALAQKCGCRTSATHLAVARAQIEIEDQNP